MILPGCGRRIRPAYWISLITRTGWCDQHAEFVAGQRVMRLLLLRGGESELQTLAGATRVGGFQNAAGLPDQGGEALVQPARQDQVPVEGLVVVAQEAWHVPGGVAAPLPFIEVGVHHRRRVLERRQQRRR